MSQFFELLLPDYSADTDVITSLPRHAVCVCCLAQNMPFVILTTCKHTGFLKSFAELLNVTNSVICHHCHNILKKIEYFRQQVEQSIIILKKQTPRSETTKARKLEISVLENINVTTVCSENIQKHEHRQNYEYEVGVTNVKVESDLSDVEADTPLSEVRRQEEDSIGCYIVKKEMNAKPIKREKVEDSSLIGEKYRGKLEMFLLTQEELQMERESLKVDKKYLGLPFKCDKCVVGFNRQIYLRNHCKQRHENLQNVGQNICGVCETVFISIFDLEAHHRRHFIRYECKACSESFIDELSAVTHYEEEHGSNHNTPPNVYKCDKCDKQYKYNYSLNAHKRSAHGAQPTGRAPYCDACRTHFRTNKILEQHLKYHSKHISEADKLLRLRMQSEHKGAAPYCVTCRKHFHTTKSLQFHLKHHSKHATEAEKKYMCDECGARFSIKAHLKGHIEWAHLKKADYQCPQCLKILRTSSSLQRHIDFVHEKKEMPRDKICDYCGKEFSTLQCLHDHIRTHTGERPYKCTQCSATFAQSGPLYTHKRLVHNPLRDTKRNGEKIK